MGVCRDLPPRGFYSAAEVGRLAGVSGRTIGQWARHGYIQSSQSSHTPRVYSYQDAAEAIAVHLYQERGRSWEEIRTAIEELRDTYGAWPLAHSGHVDGHIIDPAVGSHDDVGHHFQRFFDSKDDLKIELVSDLLARGGWAAEVAGTRFIEVNPARLSGRPTIRGTRVPVQKVASIAATPGGRQELKDGYDLTDDEIDDAVEWWEHARQYDEAA